MDEGESLWHVRQIGHKWAVFRGDERKSKPGGESAARNWARFMQRMEGRA